MGDGYGFYCLLKQPEIDTQSTSNVDSNLKVYHP